jgi:hypothetical protein
LAFDAFQVECNPQPTTSIVSPLRAASAIFSRT